METQQKIELKNNRLFVFGIEIYKFSKFEPPRSLDQAIAEYEEFCELDSEIPATRYNKIDFEIEKAVFKYCEQLDFDIDELEKIDFQNIADSIKTKCTCRQVENFLTMLIDN